MAVTERVYQMGDTDDNFKVCIPMDGYHLSITDSLRLPSMQKHSID